MNQKQKKGPWPFSQTLMESGTHFFQHFVTKERCSNTQDDQDQSRHF